MDESLSVASSSFWAYRAYNLFVKQKIMSTKRAIISLEDENPKISIIVQLEGKDYPYALVTHDYQSQKTTYQVILKRNEMIKGETPTEVNRNIELNINSPEVVMGSDLLEIAALVLKQKHRNRESAIQHELEELTNM